jgi:hypothetical protein
MRLEITAVRPETHTLCISGRLQGIEACTSKLMIAVHVGEVVSEAVENLLVRRECTPKNDRGGVEVLLPGLRFWTNSKPWMVASFFGCA